MGPEQTTEAFYTWYIQYAGGRGDRRNPIVDGAYQAGGYVSSALAQRIESARAADTLHFDPFLCAQDVPDRVTVGAAEVQGNQARVQVNTAFPGHGFTVILDRDGDRWQIAAVSCGLPVAVLTTAPATTARPAGAGRQVYRSLQYGFRLQYPAGWTFKELVSAPGQPPIGPANVRLVVQFMPQGWADRLVQRGRPDPAAPVMAPFSLELSIGTLEEYRQSYPIPTGSQSLSLGGQQAVREEERLSEELQVIRYLFTRPGVPEQRLTFMDYTSGFPERLQGNEKVISQFESMLATLTWD